MANKLGRNKKYTYEEVKEHIESIGYKLLSSEYKNNQSKLHMICDKNHDIYMTYSAIRQGKRCNVCARKEQGRKKILPYEYVKEYIESRGYKLLSTEYTRNNKKLKLICDKGHEYEASFAHFQRGNRCPKCAIEKSSERYRLDYNYVKSYIESYGYKLISKEYIKSDIKLDMICDKGHECSINWDNFKYGKRCGTCKESTGERKINEVLTKLNIKFQRQYGFEDCKLHKLLLFDFYLPDYNCCIEFDGEQHYEIIKHFGGVDKFINTKIRDTIKTEYCKKNDIKLIRIPYWEINNIDKIINKELGLE